MFERLAAFEVRLEALDRQLMDPAVASDGRRLREVATEAAHVRDIVEAWHAHRKLESDLEGAKALLAEESDPEMRELARAEIEELDQALVDSTQRIRLLLLPRDPYEGRPLLLEIRAGTGGDEAGLFASDLFRMYQRFGEAHGLRFEIMSTSTVTVGGGSGKTLTGFKEVVCGVTGADAYQLLRFEGGVHRVQRVPATEAQGRIHTSTATVAVMPEPDEVEVHVQDKDLRIDTMRAGGPGGQSVNTTDSAVRIVHIPTGITVLCMDEKSQHKNKDKAMRVLKARLLEKEQAEQKATETAARRAMVGTGDRSERIRTYNFPQNRLTDHRIGLTLYKLDAVMEGDLQELVDALTAEYQTKLLEAQDLV
ncbi:MAG: peptide chain release factor 1 [Alphaproteobacteria bacterium]|nr:peptide chain release factor 1 [Alphaproteobacteria bacterium]MCB9698525.1 peptide chain release factor 1 [Alphaproteobacteria bacterium]